MDREGVKGVLREQKIELPSWAFGNSGTRFNAYNTDVRPLLAEMRAEQSMDPDPMAAYAASGYAERIAAERVGGQQAGWGP